MTDLLAATAATTILALAALLFLPRTGRRTL